jgi:hypothetical protein
MTTFYNTFDSKIHSEELAQVSESEYDEVMRLAVEDHDEPRDFEGYDEWLNSLDNDEQAEIKDYLNGYSNNDDGPSYNGIAI